MSQVVSFSGYTPPARFDLEPWTDVRIEEASSEDGTYTAIDTLALSPVDPDPSNPAARDFTTAQGTAADLWYQVVFLDASLNESEPTTPVQNVSSSVSFIDAEAYATVEELARILKMRDPSAAQTTAMERVLLTAAGEINSEIGQTNSDLAGWQLSLATEVNLERAVEHWNQSQAPFGLVIDGGTVAYSARDSWDRHAHKLAPLKDSWGLA